MASTTALLHAIISDQPALTKTMFEDLMQPKLVSIVDLYRDQIASQMFNPELHEDDEEEEDDEGDEEEDEEDEDGEEDDDEGEEEDDEGDEDEGEDEDEDSEEDEEDVNEGELAPDREIASKHHPLGGEVVLVHHPAHGYSATDISGRMNHALNKKLSSAENDKHAKTIFNSHMSQLHSNNKN